jgi:hypothetical protein
VSGVPRLRSYAVTRLRGDAHPAQLRDPATDAMYQPLAVAARNVVPIDDVTRQYGLPPSSCAVARQRLPRATTRPRNYGMYPRIVRTFAPGRSIFTSTVRYFVSFFATSA